MVGGGWWVVVVVVLKGTLVFIFRPNLWLKFWPRPKLNNFRGRLARSSQVQGKTRTRSGQGQGKVKARSR